MRSINKLLVTITLLMIIFKPLFKLYFWILKNVWKLLVKSVKWIIKKIKEDSYQNQEI